MQKIEELGGMPNEWLMPAYLEGVIVGHEFISAGKSFWITDDEEKEDEKAVWTKHLYVDAEE